MSKFILIYRPPGRAPETSSLIEAVQLFPHRELVPGSQWIDTTVGRSRAQVVSHFANLPTHENADWCIGEITNYVEYPENWLLAPGGYFPEQEIPLKDSRPESKSDLIRIVVACRPKSRQTHILENRLREARMLRIDIVPGVCFINPEHDAEDILHDLGEEFQKQAAGIVVAQVRFFRWQSNSWLNTIYHN